MPVAWQRYDWIVPVKTQGRKLKKGSTLFTTLRDTLVAIAEDGVIDDVEKADFEVILEELLELEKQIETLKLYAATVVNLPQIIKRVKEKDRAKAAM